MSNSFHCVMTVGTYNGGGLTHSAVLEATTAQSLYQKMWVETSGEWRSQRLAFAGAPMVLHWSFTLNALPTVP